MSYYPQNTRRNSGEAARLNRKQGGAWIDNATTAIAVLLIFGGFMLCMADLAGHV